MNRVLCSTGCLLGRPNGRDFTMLPRLVPKLQCDGLELLMYDTWYDKIKDLRATVKNLDKPVHVFHLEKSIGESVSHYRLEEALERMEINCQLAGEIGAEKLVFHLWNGIISDKNIGYNIECYGKFEELAEEYGLRLTVENVVCGGGSPMAHLKKLVEQYPQIGFTYDTKMADFHKEQDLIYAPEYRHVVQNFEHFHVNDRLGEYKDWSNLRVLHVGEGNIDFDRFFAFVKTLGYTGDFTTEATSFDRATGEINLDKLNESLARLTKGVALQ